MKRTPILRKSRPKKTNPARRRKAFALAYHSKEYVAWIHTLPCVACGVVGYSECAHVGRFSGMGRKGSWRDTVPLCGVQPRGLAGCHWQSHTIGRASFEALHEIDLETEAAKIQELFRASLGSAPGGHQK